MATPIHRILLIAPDVDLPLAGAQIQAIIRSGLDVTPLLGNVTLTDVAREVEHDQHGPPYDALWIAAHGNELGILLSDGLLESSSLVQLTRGRFAVIVLNSCSSLRPALMLIRNKDDRGAAPDVVCTLTTLPDTTAYLLAARFAVELARTGNPRRAYDRAAPGDNDRYLYLAGMSNDFLAAPAG